jgi:hypothetical protein
MEASGIMLLQKTFGRLVVIAIGSIALLVPGEIVSSGQKTNPLEDPRPDKPVNITRKQKPNRKPRRARKPQAVERAPLLALEWRVFKVKDDSSQEETSPLAVFHAGDRLRLGVKTNQNGYLYIIHQASPTQPGQIIFPDSRVNGGRNDVARNQQFILPSACPAEIKPRDCALIVRPPAGKEVFTLIFTRDPMTDLPNSATEAQGGIPVDVLIKLKNDSGQTLRRLKGSTVQSVLVINTNTRDNEDIFETLLLNKGQ